MIRSIVLAVALAAAAVSPAAAQRCADVVPGERPQNTAREFVGQTLDEIVERGFIEFAIYEDFPPYSWEENGVARGVDIGVGKFIAGFIGVEPKFRFVPAGETIEADLLNYVSRGAVVDGRVSNVMLRVPYNSTLACRIEQVVMTGQYANERIAIAYREEVYPDKAPKPVVFRYETVGVENDSLSDFYLATLANGQVIPKMRHYRSPDLAMEALRVGEVTAVMGAQGQLEHGVAPGILVSDESLPGLAIGEWTVGAAVHMSHRDLGYSVGDAVTEAINDGRMASLFASYGLTFHPPAW